MKRYIVGLMHLLIIFAAVADSQTCQDAQQRSVISGNCKFTTFTESGSYNDAANFCTKDGGWVAEPQTAELNNALTSIIDLNCSKKEFYFIGLRNRNSNWMWEKDGNPLVYRNWYPYEDTNTGETYAATSDWSGGKGQWNDVTDKVPRQFACQYDPCKSNSCQKNETCSVSNTKPYYICTCKNGYYGDYCKNYFNISSDSEVIAVEGYAYDISADVTTIGNTVTVKLYFDGELIDKKTDVGSGTVTFTRNNVTKSSEGKYTFYANYASHTSASDTFMTVHVEARIESFSTDFIFSPITTGPDNVTCKVYGIPTPVYGWYVNVGEVSTTNYGSGVYQIFDNDTNVVSLHVKNANLSDDGTYMCQAMNRVGEQNEEVTKHRTTTLAVYGFPTIESISAAICTDDGAITINWKPNIQTQDVEHRLIILRENETIDERNILYPDDKTLVTNGLTPNTIYNATITVCPDECIEFLNDSSQQKTGDGTPGPVSDPEVNYRKDSRPACIATWQPPKTTNGTITSYHVEWTSTYVYNPSEDLSEPDVITSTVEPVNQHGVLDTEPNRQYTAVVYAKTCAGGGTKVPANGSCTTSPAPPNNVTQPEVASAEADSPTRQITIQPIDYTNGPVSCVYVVVQKEDTWNGKKFNPDDLKTLQDNALNGNKSEYLSLAFPGDSIGPDGNVTYLGDASTTGCDATSTSQQNSRRERATGNHLYEARNIELEHTGVTYSFLILTATPVKDTFQLSQSPVQTFVQGSSESGSSIVWVAGVVAGVLLVAAIPAFIYFRRIRASKGDNDSDMPLRETADIGRPEVSAEHPRDDTAVAEERVGKKQEKQGHKIPLEMLENVYRAMKCNESAEFQTEFGELKRVAILNAPPSDFGKDEALKKKNRFKNIIPYDSTRVILQGDDGNGYINACYVKGPNKTFIASQGPLPNTVHDFWRMVVEQRCRIIVMLTRCEEAGKKKCERYWPKALQVAHHSLYIVRNMNEKHFGGYVRRELKILTQSDEEFTVDHYQFLGWPDHGVPKITSNFFRLHHDVMKSHEAMKADAPVLVHCSAGVGRTGAFIGFDILLAESKKRKSIDVYNCVMEMRQQRVDMVQTCGQYEFLHKLLLENYLFGETDVSVEELLASNKRKVGTYQKEFQNLTKVESLPSTEENTGFSPGFGNRVVIVRQPDDTEWISIDTTFVEAYHHDTRLMAAQSPSKSTVEYFWRAILDNEVDAVVMLNSIDMENGGHEQYWPYTRNQVLRVNNLSIRMVAENEIRGTVHRSLVVSREVRQQIQKREIKHYQYLGWRERAVPEDSHGIIDLLDDTRNRERRFSTVLVHSSKGIGRTGTFCALFNLMERLKNENKLDVFRAVKDLRELRPRMVDNLEQYKFCYDVATEYLTSRNVYANEALESGPTGPVYENL